MFAQNKLEIKQFFCFTAKIYSANRNLKILFHFKIQNEYVSSLIFVQLLYKTLNLKSFTVHRPIVFIVTFEVFFQEYAFLEESLTDRMTKSTLIIRKSESHHFGHYNCTVVNVYGMDSIEIDLVPESKYYIILHYSRTRIF